MPIDDPVTPTGLTRTPDYATSNAAAAKIRAGKLSDLHRAVLGALSILQPATDEQIKAYIDGTSEPGQYAESTIRKRRTELTQAQRVRAHGEQPNARGDKMTTWVRADWVR